MQFLTHNHLSPASQLGTLGFNLATLSYSAKSILTLSFKTSSPIPSLEQSSANPLEVLLYLHATLRVTAVKFMCYGTCQAACEQNKQLVFFWTMALGKKNT